MLMPVRPVREVGEGDDADAADARGLAQHHFGIAQVLQRVDLQHDVEGGVVEHREAFVEVELDHVDAAPHALQHVAVGDLHAVAAAAALSLQQVEQRAVAAAEVEHARAFGNEAGDHALVHRRSLMRVSPSFAMRSK